jgi:hypothetical protein
MEPTIVCTCQPAARIDAIPPCCFALLLRVASYDDLEPRSVLFLRVSSAASHYPCSSLCGRTVPEASDEAPEMVRDAFSNRIQGVTYNASRAGVEHIATARYWIRFLS